MPSPAEQLLQIKVLLEDPFGDQLPKRQARAAKLAAFGWTTGEIAEEMGITKDGAGSLLRQVKATTGKGKYDLTKDLIARLQKIVG